jgi:WD40 repeat protein
VYSACLSADERLVATASYDCSARIWELASGRCLHTLAHKRPVTAVALSPDGRRAATVTEANDCWLWEVQSGRCLARLAGHKEAVAGALFTPCSLYAVTYSPDCTVQVWAAHTGRQHALFMADSAVTSCCMASDAGAAGGADVLVAGVSSGAVHFIELAGLL